MLAERLSADRALAGQAFNFSNENEVSSSTLVQKILNLMESDLKPVVLNEVTNEIFFQALNARKAKERLGWQPLYSLDDGLKETIQWYRKFLA
jgi:CDP-glucose 4,6-dehydratase